jgi:hypothetical protein
MTQPQVAIPLGLNTTARHPLSAEIRAGAYPLVPDPLARLVDAEDQVAELQDRELAATAATFTAHLDELAGRLVVEHVASARGQFRSGRGL